MGNKAHEGQNVSGPVLYRMSKFVIVQPDVAQIDLKEVLLQQDVSTQKITSLFIRKDARMDVNS